VTDSSEEEEICVTVGDLYKFVLRPEKGSVSGRVERIWLPPKPRSIALTRDEMRALHGLEVRAVSGPRSAIAVLTRQTKPAPGTRKPNGKWVERVNCKLQLGPIVNGNEFLGARRIVVEAKLDSVKSDKARLSVKATEQSERVIRTAREREAKYRRDLEANREQRRIEREERISKQQYVTLYQASQMLGLSFGSTRQLMLAGKLGDFERRTDKHPNGRLLKWDDFRGVWWISKTGVSEFLGSRRKKP
jgi:hypothetical protein